MSVSSHPSWWDSLVLTGSPRPERISFTRKNTGRVTSYPTFQGPAGGPALVSSHSETGTARLPRDSTKQASRGYGNQPRVSSHQLHQRLHKPLSLRVWTATAYASGPLKLSSLRTSLWTPCTALQRTPVVLLTEEKSGWRSHHRPRPLLSLRTPQVFSHLETPVTESLPASVLLFTSCHIQCYLGAENLPLAPIQSLSRRQFGLGRPHRCRHLARFPPPASAAVRMPTASPRAGAAAGILADTGGR